MSANAEQAEFWSGPSGRSWIEWEADQDRLLAPVSDLVIDGAGLVPGGSVVDIGCGTGALTEMAAGAVGRDGRVLATDISQPLLARAAERARGLPQVATLLADAATVRWPPPPFDVAVSRLGVMFFADPPAALSNVRRALRTGGRAVFACWGTYEDNPYWTLAQRAATARMGRPPPPEPRAPGPMQLSDASYAREVMDAAGFTRIEARRVEIALGSVGDAAALADLATRIGPASRVLRLFEGDETDRLAVADALARDFARWEDGGEARVPATINLLTGRAPD